MKIQLATKPLSEAKGDYLVLPVFQEETEDFGLPIVKSFLKENPKFGKSYESQVVYYQDQKLLLLGLGKKDKFNFGVFQNWVGAAVRNLAKRTKQISIVLPKTTPLSADEVGQAVAIGADIAAYDPTKDYKSEHEPIKLISLEVLVERAERGYQDGLKKGLIVADSINLVRRLGDMPANEMTPTYFLNVARRIAKENRLKLVVIDEKMAKKKGMGAFVGVARGSEEPSYIIALEYKGDVRTKEKWGLVGKGITFDSGGISIKPSANMHEMKYDMTGAAAVMGALVAIAKLGLRVNVCAVMAVTENLPSGRAQKPGDIVRTYSGKTAEVLNTDAEGRLVLVDALAYAQKDLKCTKLVDLATLTGAVVVALGDFYTGAFGNTSTLSREVMKVGEKVGERIWELPMTEEYDEMIKSEIADITNIGHGGSMPGAAGSITGAKFLEAVIDKNVPWVHLDIAGTAWDMKSKPFRGVGATGVGVKTLVKLIGG